MRCCSVGQNPGLGNWDFRGGCQGPPSASRRLSVKISAQAKRQPKNPKDYSGMDEIRKVLQENSGQPVGLANLLTWVGNVTFGKGNQNGLASFYRRFLSSSKLQSLDSGMSKRPGYRPTPADMKMQASQAVHEPISTGIVAKLESNPRVMYLAMLLSCSPAIVAMMAERYPPLLSLSPKSFGQRLVSLKSVLPECDVTILMEKEPKLFLEQNQKDIEDKVSENYNYLKKSLVGANVKELVEESPSLLFIDLKTAVQQILELTIDEQAQRNSSPVDLAQAIMALSDQGPSAKS